LFLVVISVVIYFSLRGKKLNFFKTFKEQKEEYFDSDLPIKTKEEDLLNRKNFIDNLINILKNNLINNKDCFIIGINGSWGTGKTSILNCIKHELLQNKENFILVEFNPWMYHDSKLIIDAFYKNLKNKISERYFYPLLDLALNRYFKKIRLSLGMLDLEFLLKNDVQYLKETINNFLKAIPEKVVIIIDDLDRLEKNEILKVLKLVRINSDFSNTVFILSFDIDKVAREIKGLGNEIYDEQYLEKIIQIKLNLPQIENDILKDILKKEINELSKEIIDKEFNIEDLFMSWIFDTKNFPSLDDITKYKLNTLRAIKRYLNALKIELTILKDEIDIGDLVIFELIKVYYTEIYNYLYYFGPQRIIDMLEKNHKQLSEQLKQMEKINDEEANFVIKLLRSIFDIQKALNPKSISNPDSFNKYFILNTPVNDIPEYVISDIIDGINNKDNKKLEFLLSNIGNENKLDKLLKKLTYKLEDVTDENNLSNFINILLEHYDKFKKSELITHSFISFISNYRSNTEIIKKVVTNGDIGLACKLIIKIKDKIQKKDFEKIKDYYIKRLDNHFIDGKKDIFELYDKLNKNVFLHVLYSWVGEFTPYRINTKVSDYLVNLFKDNIKSLDNFLSILFLSDYTVEDKKIPKDLIIQHDRNKILKGIFFFDRIIEILDIIEKNPTVKEKFKDYNMYLIEGLTQQLFINKIYEFEIKGKKFDEDIIIDEIWKENQNLFSQKNDINEIIGNFWQDGWLSVDYLSIKNTIERSSYWDDFVKITSLIIDEYINFYNKEGSDKLKFKGLLTNKITAEDKLKFEYLFEKLDSQLNLFNRIESGEIHSFFDLLLILEK